MWFYIAETRRLSSSRFPQGPTASKPVGKLHTFGVEMGTFVPKWRPKVFWLAILSSTAAGLRVPFYLASTSGCKEKVHLRLGTGSASGVTWGFFPFCQVSCRFPHKPAPQGRGDCSLRSQTPLAAAPRWGLPARYFVCRQNIQACGRISRFFIGGYSALSHAYQFVPI